MNTTNPNQSSQPGTSTQTYDGVTDLIPINLYHVFGLTGEYFTTKLAAEVRARKAFPNDDPNQRHSRIFYQRFFKEV